MGVVGGECAVKGTGGKSHPCHCCSSRVSSAGGTNIVSLHQQHQYINQQNRQHRSSKKYPEADLPICNSSPGNSTTDSPILAPLRSKMKVLKKLKRKMGLGKIFILFKNKQIYSKIYSGRIFSF